MRKLPRIRGLILFVILSTVFLTLWPDREPVHSFPATRFEHTQGWADERVCADCHFEQTERFADTGHARTLQRAEDAESVRLLKQFQRIVKSKDGNLSLALDSDRIRAIDRSGKSPRTLRLDWCFGSGDHARTWVGTLPGSWGDLELVEFRWSWFHHPDDFGVTPGQQEPPRAGYFHSLGMMFDAPKARRCFACHATVLPQTEGRIDLQGMHAGVTCQRCHGPRQQHVDSEGEIREEFWATASPMETINRCGECHRVAEDQTSDEIQPDNPDIVRFQPIGLTQSPCFRSSASLTCMTCHDPHRPLNEQDSLGIWQCVQCHDGNSGRHRLCGAGHRIDCLSCHMPKVEVFDSVWFTDHWIRVPTTPAKPSP